MVIRKVVIPLAGLGTRLFPTTKALPKEMLPVGRHPAIQHVVEEMIDANLNKFLFVTSREKTIIENQFDNRSDVVVHLEQNSQIKNFPREYNGQTEFFYTRQQIPRGNTKPEGTAAAIASAESFVENEHFVVAYGDSIIQSKHTPNLMTRMVETHSQYNAACTLAVRNVPLEQISRYGIVKPTNENNLQSDNFEIEDIVEKPNPDDAPSCLAISARYVFGPEIFSKIRKLRSISDGEIGITDAIKILIQSGHTVRCIQLRKDEIRYDIGNHESYFKAFIDFALQDQICGRSIREYIKTCLGAKPNLGRKSQP